LPDFSEVLIWNGTGYVGYFSDSGSPSLWDDVNFGNLANAPTISVAQGFYLIPNNTFTWNVGL